MSKSDPRLDQAKLIPILEVAAQLGVGGLQRAGVEHVGPCPVCGGNDRFAINPRRGVFNCRSCNAGGDGIALVQFVEACGFRDALRILAGDAEAAPDQERIKRLREKAEAKAQQQRDYEAVMRARAIRDARETVQASKPGAGTLVDKYLRARGIVFDVFPPTIGFIPDHPYTKSWRGRSTEWFRGPCMIAAIQNASGRVVAVHQTWLDPSEPGKKRKIIDPDGNDVDAKGKPYPAKLVRGSKKGGAIRLSPMQPLGKMVMGEGIETTASALTVNACPGAVYWAGVDLGNMSGRQVRVPGQRHSGIPDMADEDAWLPPDWVKELFFILDGDSAPKATVARLEAGLRRAMAARPGLIGKIVDPGEGLDLNDLLQKTKNDEGDQ
jgi:hypothetical protein